MKILVPGGNGQLGRALATSLTAHNLLLLDLPDFDISNRGQVASVVEEFQPDIVVNAAAYTNVDGCVDDFDTAYKANALGPHNLALICAEHDIPLVQVSTNEVFPGEKASGYYEWDAIRPINAYGRSKTAGEVLVRNSWRKHYIVRTAWLYAHGGRNFIHAILGFADKYGKVKVVTDEVGNPTYAKDLATAISQLIETRQYGTYHFVNSGSASRWEFANEILKLAGFPQMENKPIFGSEFKRKSTPPPYCALHNTAGKAIGIELRPWQDALADYMKKSHD